MPSLRCAADSHGKTLAGREVKGSAYRVSVSSSSHLRPVSLFGFGLLATATRTMSKTAATINATTSVNVFICAQVQ